MNANVLAQRLGDACYVFLPLNFMWGLFHIIMGYRRVRHLLASQYNRDNLLPDVQIVRYDRDGDRSLSVRHAQHRNRPLTEDSEKVMRYLARLWGFPVRLETVNAQGRQIDTEEFTPAS